MQNTPLFPIVVGAVATALAVARLVTWLAVGEWFTADEDTPAASLAGIVIGSAVTASCYAVFALAGHLALALALDGVIALTALVMNGRAVVRRVRDLKADGAAVLRAGPWTRALALAWMVLAWVCATALPRDADVLRYHLAHVREIAQEGRWTRIADTAYALPFGWSLTYLPFEMLHVSVAAQMLNLAIWIIIVLTLYARLRDRASLPIRLLVFGLACQPMVFRAVTTAHLDVYVMMLMTVVALLIDPGPIPTMRTASGRIAAPLAAEGAITGAHLTLSLRGAALLGFCAWIGAQSRYQAIGIGVAAFLILIGLVARRAVRPQALAAAAVGGVVASVLAAPFYLANLRWFDDPVWPFLVRRHPAAASATDRVAMFFAQRTTAPFDLSLLPHGLFSLAIDITVFPIPWIVAGAIAAGWWVPRTRRLAAFVTCYVAIWAAVTPVFFPRFIIFLVPVVPLLTADALAPLAIPGMVARRCAVGALVAYCAVVAGLLLAYSAESVRYALTGDRTRYERATWFAPVFAWADTATSPKARFLVIVKSGGTYALDRLYRRADPEGSAVVDWTALEDGRALVDRLHADGYQYVIYEDRDWRAYPGGLEMARVIHDATDRGLLAPVETFSLQLVNSRLLGHSIPSTVRVFEVRGAAGS